MRVVITGGPLVGKTTIINHLEALGYPVVHEQATKLITEGHLMPWTDRVNFQKEVLRRQLEAEDAVAEGDKAVFLDRGLFDGEAYYIFDKLEVPRIFDSLDASRYGLALLIEELPIYEESQLHMRGENLEISRQISRLLEDCYRRRHIPVARIPAMPPNERIDYVLEKVKQFMGQESKLSSSGKHSIVELQQHMAGVKY
jgi:predicted ATPase